MVQQTFIYWTFALLAACELPFCPLKSQTTTHSFSFVQGLYALAALIVRWSHILTEHHMNAYVTNLVIFPVNLTHVNLITSPARRTRLEGKLFFLPRTC